MYPTHPLETNVAAFVGDVRKGSVNPVRQWETEPSGMRVPLPAKSRFGGFRPLFTRSIKAQIKGRSRLCVRPAHKAPQCGAFQGNANRSRFGGFAK